MSLEPITETALTAKTDSHKSCVMRVALNLFIVTYLVIHGLWLCPPSLWRTRLLSPIKEAWQYFGLDQSYTVFAPGIREYNHHVIAEVSFSDGSRKLWLFPQASDYSPFESWKIERTRKWTDWLVSPAGAFLRPDAAGYIARRQTESGMQPTHVSIREFTAPIPKPVDAKQPLSPRKFLRTLYARDIRPEDLP